MLVCGVDLETTGLLPGDDYITEIGAALFKSSSWEPQATFSTFVYEPKALPLTPEIVKLTGITDDMVKSGSSIINALQKFEHFSEQSQAFVAHNKDFDQAFLLASAARAGYTFRPEFKAKPWICSKNEVKTHFGRRCTKLSHLAVDYGLLVDGSKLHRALDDVLLMGQVLAKSDMTLNMIIDWIKEPWIYMEALVEKPWLDAGKSTSEAKKHGYGWEKAYGDSYVFSKKWIKRCKESEYEAEKAIQTSFKRIRVTKDSSPT